MRGRPAESAHSYLPSAEKNSGQDYVTWGSLGQVFSSFNFWSCSTLGLWSRRENSCVRGRAENCLGEGMLLQDASSRVFKQFCAVHSNIPAAQVVGSCSCREADGTQVSDCPVFFQPSHRLGKLELSLWKTSMQNIMATGMKRMGFWSHWNKNMKRNVCEIQNMRKSVQEGVMMASEVRIAFFFFPLWVLSCA